MIFLSLDNGIHVRSCHETEWKTCFKLLTNESEHGFVYCLYILLEHEGVLTKEHTAENQHYLSPRWSLTELRGARGVPSQHGIREHSFCFPVGISESIYSSIGGANPARCGRAGR